MMRCSPCHFLLTLIALFTAFKTSAAPVIIKSQPKAVTINAGSTASFNVLASTITGPLTYQWQYKGTNLVGETNSTLILENVSTNQFGAYRVIVRSIDRSVTSATANLRVLQGTFVQFQIRGTNVVVELFDHDKPVTVQNFLRYVKAGIYTNTFFHRLVPGFVLQGGGYGTGERGTNSFGLTNVFDLYSWALYDSGLSFAPYIMNESTSGPKVRNTFGTLAMARISNPYDTNGGVYTNSANSQWFFNLADNSTNLDNVSGGFTVFGRIIQGADSLNYFNNLSLSNGIVDLTSAWPTNSGKLLSELPVQSGESSLRNTDLYYANISFLTKPVFDPTPPKISVTNPAKNTLLTNGTVTIQGKASDLNGIGYINCWLVHYPITTTEYPSLFEEPVNIGSNWSVGMTNMEPGQWLAQMQAWDGFGNVTSLMYPFVIPARLQVQVHGLGKVTPNLDGKFLEIGTVAPYGTFKVHHMKAIPSSGQLFAHWEAYGSFVKTPDIYFNMTTNLVVKATFVSNNFPKVVGTYNGLFYPTNSMAAANAGFCRITPTTAGSYSGQILLAGKALSLSGKFDYTGKSQTSIKPPGTTNLISISLSIDLTNNTGIVSGTVSSSGWNAPLLAYRGATKLTTNTFLKPGKYVLNISGKAAATNEPSADSYATFSASSSGILTLAGKLADATTATPFQSVMVSKEGNWPVYASLYGGKGLLLGWQTFDSETNCSGTLRWIKPAMSNGTYTNGFNISTDANGHIFAAPVPNTLYQIVLGGGELGQPLTNIVKVDAKRQFVNLSGTANQLKVTLNTSTGLLTGQFFIPNATKPQLFYGAFQNPENGGSGFFIDLTQKSGYFQLTPLPNP